MLRFYLFLLFFISLSIHSFSQGFYFDKSFNQNIANDCRNGGSVTTASLTVSGLDNLSNELELLFAGADMTITQAFDLKITLISPQGTRATFIDTRGGSTHQVTLGKYNLFRVRNCSWFPPHTAPQIIPWQAGKLFVNQPVTDFGIFRGEDPNGEWKFEFCTSNASPNLSLGYLMLDFRSLKTIIRAPVITKKPTDCLSADGSINFDVATKCDQGVINYQIDNGPRLTKLLPVDYRIGFTESITLSATGLTSGVHTIKAALGDLNGVIDFSTYNERVFTLDAATANNGDVQVSCAGDFTIGTGTTGQVDVKLLPPTHWDNCGYPTSITKITGKFPSGDVNVDVATQSLTIQGNGTVEFIWEITNSKGLKKTCSSFVKTVPGNVAVFTADVCKNPVKAPKCGTGTPLFIPINISQLQDLGNKNTLDKVEITMKFPGKITGEAYLTDPKGIRYALFDASSFPTYNNSGSITVEFTASTDPNVKRHDSAILPSANDKLRKSIVDLNFLNITKVKPNGTWNLVVCGADAFDIQCFKLHFNDACTKDLEAPRFTQCPSHRVVTLNANNTLTFPIIDPFSTDNCKVKSRFQELFYSGGAKLSNGDTYIKYENIDAYQGTSYDYDVVGKGLITIKYTTIDEANNAGYCYVYVVVVAPNDCANDQVKPTLVNCVQDFEIVAYPNGLTDYWTTEPDYYDNCGIKSVQLNISYLNGTKSPKNTTFETINSITPNTVFHYLVSGTGTVKFEYLVTDLKGNVGSCITNVTVKSPNTPGSDPCTTFNPSLSVAGGNCTNTSILSVDNAANAVKVDWKNGSQIVQSTVASATPATQGSTAAGTGVAGNSTSQFDGPAGLFIDKKGNMYVSDIFNDRVMKFAPGATVGQIVAGGNGKGNALNQFDSPAGIHVDNAENLYVVDLVNTRVMRWSPGANAGVVVAGGNGVGNAQNQLNNPIGISVDPQGNVFVGDGGNYRVQKWTPGATTGITVAGTGVSGQNANQLDSANFVMVNDIGEIFVLEGRQGVVKKFPANSTAGTASVIVAKDKLAPRTTFTYLYLDAAGNIYFSNFREHYVKKFPPNGNENTPGIVVAGGNGAGNGANQLNGPRGLATDPSGNLYVSDRENQRVQKWNQTYSALNNTLKPTAAGTYTAEVTRMDGCKKTTNSITITECNNSNSLLFYIANGCINPGTTGSFPVTVNNFNGIGAFSFDLTLPANSNLKFEKVDNLGITNINFNVLSNGDLRVVWDEPNGSNINLASGTRICDVFISSTAAFNQLVTVNSKEIVVLSNSGVSSGVVSAFTVCASAKTNVSGTVKNPIGKAIANVNMGDYNPSAQAFVTTVQTNANGEYTLQQVTPTHQITAGRNDDPTLGVNIADVARIRRHFLQTALLDADFKKMAADVDMNGKIDVIDVAATNRIVLKKIDKFPNNVPSWRCVPADLNISANPLDVNHPWWIDLAKPGLNTSKLDFIAVKVGDVDHSASITEEVVYNRSAPVLLTIPDTMMAASQNMVVPVYIAGGDKISIFSMDLTYDTSKVKLTKIESSMMQGFGTGNYNDTGSKVIIAWDHPQGGDFVGNGTLMRLTFSNKVTTGTSPLNMSNINVFDTDFNQYNTTQNDGSLTMGTSGVADGPGLEKLKVYPNPWSEVMNVEVSLTKPEKLKLEIMDSAGKLLRVLETESESGQHLIQIRDLEYKGVLILKAKTGSFTKTFKVFKI